jgi:hypothetical protein
MFSKRMISLVLVAVIGATMSACSWNAERNADGSWTVTGRITETEMQGEITAALADPLIRDVQVDFEDGYILATAQRESLDGLRVEEMTFRVDLGIINGHLSIMISNVLLDGAPMEDAQVTVWNERLANRLENAGERHPNSTLESITLTQTDLTMVWRAEGRRGRS